MWPGRNALLINLLILALYALFACLLGFPTYLRQPVSDVASRRHLRSAERTTPEAEYICPAGFLRG